MAKRNFHEGCPLAHPFISRITGRTCLAGCIGSSEVPKYEVCVDENGLRNNAQGVMKVRVSVERFCGLREVSEQLTEDEILGVDEQGEAAVYDRKSVLEPKYVFVNYG